GRGPSNVIVTPDLAVTRPGAKVTAPQTPASRGYTPRGDEGPSMAKKLALLAVPVVLFVVGGAVIVGLRKDAGTAQAAPPPPTTQVISVDPPKAQKPTEVAVKITSTPPGASVFLGDSYYGTTPMDLNLPRKVSALTFK